MSITIRQYRGDTTIAYSKIVFPGDDSPVINAVTFDRGYDMNSPQYSTRADLEDSWRRAVQKELAPYGITVSDEDVEIMHVLCPLMFEDCIASRGYELTFARRKLSGEGQPLRLSDTFARGELKNL